METQSKYLERLLKEAEHAIELVNRNYYFFKDEQLNWRPAPKSWSIGEIYEHLINSNILYYDLFDEKIKSGIKINGDVPFSHTIIGKMILNSVSPETKRKVKTFKVFEPTSSVLDQDIIMKFKSQHERLMFFIKEASQINLKKTKFVSPAKSFIRYNMGDALGILVYHTHRHLNQIDRVSKLYNK